MRYHFRKKPFFSARYRVPRSKRSYFKRIFLGFMILFVLFSLGSEWALRSVSDELVEQAVREYIERNINITASAYEDESAFLGITRNGAGKIISAEADTQKMNKMKTELTSTLEKKLNGTVKTTIPFGSATGIGILNGRGFPVPLRLNLEGSAQVAFQTEFLSAGINQSCYRVTMHIRYFVHSQSRKFSTDLADSTSFVLSETIIVGDVPQFMAGAAA